jgi:hypothetical protein
LNAPYRRSDCDGQECLVIGPRGEFHHSTVRQRHVPSGGKSGSEGFERPDFLPLRAALVYIEQRKLPLCPKNRRQGFEKRFEESHQVLIFECRVGIEMLIRHIRDRLESRRLKIRLRIEKYCLQLKIILGL